jgi:dienelactone hydrolase
MRTLLTLFMLTVATNAYAEIQTKIVEYKDGETMLEGFLAWDDTKAKVDGSMTAPGVMIVHQWLGLTDYEKSRAKQLAELGYVAFAADIYGKNERPAGMQQAGPKAGSFKSNRELYRKRLMLGLDQLKAIKAVDVSDLAAIGYCFGGTGVIELARAGAEIDGVVSFHGGLDSPKPEDGKNIKTKVLICHGADDPFMTVADIDAMKSEFNAARVDWQMIYYSNAVHSFTQPMAGNDNSRGAAYNKAADERSWHAMKDFFEEVFAD